MTGKYTLVGVVSYGAGTVHDSCGEWGAYTKVSRFLPFIKKTNYWFPKNKEITFDKDYEIFTINIAYFYLVLPSKTWFE